MTAARIVTAALARQCQRDYDAGKGTMRAIAKRYRVSEWMLRRARKRLGLTALQPGGGGVRKFGAEAEDLARWNAPIMPGWRVHGEARE